jgi:putative endonuclease
MNSKSEDHVKVSNKALGAFGEQVVADFLLKQGAVILDRNWRIKEGEIDLVAQFPKGVVAFVEVKTRSSLTFGHPLDSIDRQKAHRLQRLALAWLATHGYFGGAFQIDCAAVLVDRFGQHTIDYRTDIL